MKTTTPYPSVASIGEAIGGLIERHFDLAMRAMLRGPHVDGDARFVRLVTGGPHPFANFAVVSNPSELEGTGAAIEKLLTCGAPAAVLFPGSVAAPVNRLMHERGFQPHEPMPAMAVDIQRLGATTLPEGYTFVRIGAGADGAAWADCYVKGYELPPVVSEVFSPEAIGVDMAADAPMQFYAVLKDARPVCTSALYLAQGVAGSYCVATLPEERGKGLGAHATAEPLRIAQGFGYGVGVLQSSPAGYSVYKRLGVAEFGVVSMYVRTPARAPTATD